MPQKKTKFSVLAWPAFSNKAGNPYNYLIYSEIEKMGHPVHEFEFNIRNIQKFIFSDQYKVLHIHWPTNILTHSTYLQAKRRILMLKYFLKIIKLLNKKVVWTVHNLQGHEADHPLLQKELNKVLFQEVDGFISLNKSGLSLIEAEAKNKPAQKFRYIPHPVYKGYYPNDISRDEARTQLAIPADKFVFLFLGQIRKYKNVLNLVKAFKGLEQENKFLLIAGKVHEELQNELLKATEKESDISLHNGFVEDKELQVYLNACDLVITPYSNIFNSGSIFLNFSFNKPTLAPQKGIFIELQQEMGSDAVILYDGEISSEHLKNSIGHSNFKNKNLDNLKPVKIAEDTVRFYKELIGLDKS